MKCEKFQGQIESDHDLFFREGVFTQQEGRGQFIWVVPAEFKAEAMKIFREKDAIPALASLGFVPMSATEIQAIARNYKGAGELLTLGMEAILFRAKDNLSLQRATEKMALVGSREEGPLTCIPAQAFIAIKFPGQFDFTNGNAQFMVQLSIQLYGINLRGEGAKGNGVVGFCEPIEVSTLGFLDDVRSAFSQRRPKDQGSAVPSNRGETLAAPAGRVENVRLDPYGLVVAIQRYSGKAGHFVDNRVMVNVDVKPGIAGTMKTGEVMAILPDGIKQLSLRFYPPIPGHPEAMSAFNFELTKPGHHEIVFQSKDDPTKTDRFSFDYKEP